VNLLLRHSGRERVPLFAVEVRNLSRYRLWSTCRTWRDMAQELYFSGVCPLLKVKEEKRNKYLPVGVMSLVYVKVNSILKLLTNFKV
jgi:hypothetical protein